MPDTMDITSFPTISTSHSNSDDHSNQPSHSLHGQRMGRDGEEKSGNSNTSTIQEPIRTTPSTIWTGKNRGVIGVNVGVFSFISFS